MQIQNVVIENYASYHGTHTIPIHDAGLVLVLGHNADEPRMDSNGAAKSSIFEAIDWCLFGVIPKGDHVDSIINDESSSVMVRVTLFDEDEGEPLVVCRQKTRGKAVALHFEKKAEVIKALDTKETQRWLEAELGIDRDVFHAAVFYAQTDMLKFAESSESKRIELLSKILPELAQIDAWLEPAKVLAKEAAEKANRAGGEAAKAFSRLDEARSSMRYIADQIRQREQERRDRIINLRRSIATAHEHHANAQKQLHSLVTEREALARVRAPTPPADLPAAKQAYEDARQNESAWKAHEHAAREELKRLQTRLERLQAERSGACSLCGQPLSPEHIARESALLQQQIQEAQHKANTANQAAKSWNSGAFTRQQTVQRLEQQFAADERAYMAQRAKLEGMGQAVARVEGDINRIKTDIANMEREEADCRAQPNPAQSQQAQTEARCQELQRVIDQSNSAAKAWKDRQALFDFWVAAFGAKGLRNYVLDNRLKEMTDAANHWVRLLTGGTIWVRFETQKMGRSTKKLSNEINIRVFRFNQDGRIVERNYKSWSGGEKRRVGWAIDFGLSRLIAGRARKRYDLLILDEVFRHVDAAGGEAVMEMLRELRQERNSIFVIEHDSAFKAQFDTHWLVEKKNQRSLLMGQEAGGCHDFENRSEQTEAPSKTPRRAKSKKAKVVSSRAPVKARSRA